MKRTYLYYQGQYYDVGTVVKVKTQFRGIKEATFRGWRPSGTTFLDDGITGRFYWFETEEYIVEIVNPVYPRNLVETSDERERPAPWDVEIGWIWYTIIMAVGLIFNDRILIWAVASIIFFSWKSGLMNGGKK